MAKQYLKTERARNWDQFSLLCTDLNPASKKEQELAEKQNKLYLHAIQNYTFCHFGTGTQSYTSNSSPCPSCNIAHLFSSCPTCSFRDGEARNGHWRAKGLHPTTELLCHTLAFVTYCIARGKHCPLETLCLEYISDQDTQASITMEVFNNKHIN